jgi:hypothetical protein
MLETNTFSHRISLVSDLGLRMLGFNVTLACNWVHIHAKGVLREFRLTAQSSENCTVVNGTRISDGSAYDTDSYSGRGCACRGVRI